jgi:hypothetical protein
MSKNWSDEQNAIFAEFSNGRNHFAVVARAGSGKTTTIEHGISLAPEDKKVYLAFNKKNVVEAKAKIKDPRCQIMSLNGLGFRFVVQNWKGVETDDTVEFDRIKAVIADDRVFKNINYPPLGIIRDIVAFAKNTCPFAKYDQLVGMAQARGFEPDDRQEERGWTTDIFCRIAERAMAMAKIRDKKNRISFNDQLWLPVVMNWARPWFSMVVVDECQDMNATQLILARKACKPAGRMVMVGDPRQSIYGFRGADVDGMDRLQKELRAKTFPLTITYRCGKNIVGLAQLLVPDYRAADTAHDGIVSVGKVEDAIPGDAIISRTNAPLMTVCLGLLRRGVRAYIEGRDVGAALAGLHEKFVNSPDIASYLLNLDTWASDRIMRLTGEAESDSYKAALSNIQDQAQTLAALAQECLVPSEIGRRLFDLFADSSTGGRAPSVVLSSVHKAKGMEWGRVFLLKDTFRCSWDSTVSQNNNITYVAITRAKSELFWVVA